MVPLALLILAFIHSPKWSWELLDIIPNGWWLWFALLELLLYVLYALVVVTYDSHYPGLYSIVAYLFYNISLFRRLIQGFFSLLSGLIFFLYHQLRHCFQVMWFFSRRHVYSAPSYTGYFYYSMPKFYNWLVRMSYKRSFSKKYRAFKSRQSYLIFVWFSFSYFFRALILFPRLLCIAFYRWLISAANGLFAVPLISFYFIFYWIFSNTLGIILQRYSTFFSRISYDYYLRIRRYLYYINSNEYTGYWTSIWTEKAKNQKERRAFFDPHTREWNLNSAAPRQIPPMRPSFFYFLGRFVDPLGSKAMVARATKLWGYHLVSFLILVSKALLFSLWWPFLLVIENVLLALEDSPTSFAVRTAFLTNLSHLSKIVSGRGSAVATFVLLPFWMLGNLILLAWPSLSLPLIRIGTYVFYVLYVTLWNFLLLVTKVPMVMLYIFTRPVVFFFRRFHFFLWVFLFFSFGGYFLICLGYLLGELLPVASGLFNIPSYYVGLYPEQRFALYWQAVSQRRFGEKWLGHMNTTYRHWWRKWYYTFHSTINYDPFSALGTLQYYFAAAERRGTGMITHFHREMLIFYSSLQLIYSGKGIKKVYLLLDKLVQPAYLDYHKGFLTWEYGVAYFWIKHGFNFFVSPILILSFLLFRLENYLIQLVASARAHHIWGFLVNFYVEHYLYLWDGALALYSLCIPAIFNWGLFLKNQTISLFHDGRSIILQWAPLIFHKMQVYWAGQLVVMRLYLKQQFFNGNLWGWYGQLLLDCFQRQWSLCLALVASEAVFTLPTTSWFYSPSAILASFIAAILSLSYSIVPLAGPDSLNLSSADLFRFYLCSVIFLIKFWDTIGIYWQLAKLSWQNFADWEHYRHIRKHSKSIFLKHKHTSRRSWFSPMFVNDIWQTLVHVCYDRPFVHPSGSEIRPTYSKWALVSEIWWDERRIFLVLSLLAKGDFYHPWYSPPHSGYFLDPLTGKRPGEYNYSSFLSSPLVIYLSQLRVWGTPLEGPFIYFTGLFILVLLSPSFRGLFFPRLFEGSTASHWNRFILKKDPQQHFSLAMPPLPTYDFEWYEDSLDYEQQILQPASSYLKKVQKDASWYSENNAIHSFKAYKNLLNSLRNQVPATQNFRQRALKSTRKAFWNLFPLTGRSKFSPAGRRLQMRWESKLWPHFLDFRNSYYFKDLSYSNFFHDFKILAVSQNLYKLYFALPEKTIDFLASFGVQGNFDLEAAYACSNFDEQEEIRAEYLYRSDLLHQRLVSFLLHKLSLAEIDRLYFDSALGAIFYHKDGVTDHWISENMDALMANQALRLPFTPLIFSKYLRSQRYLLSYPEDPSSYPFFCFWFLIFPLILIAEAFLRHYNFEAAWSPRKGRYSHSESWGLWVNIFLHFDILVDTLDYLWSVGSTTIHMVRAGARGALDEPGKWWRKSDVTGTFYFWDWLTHWRFATIAFRTYNTPWLFRSNNLSELRIFNAAMFFLHLLLVLIFFWKYYISRRKPRFFIILGFEKIPSLSAMFAPLDFYRRTKQQLYRGIRNVWLKRKR